MQNYFSEANHNELEVLRDDRFIYLFLRNSFENERIQKRFEIIKELYKNKNIEFFEIRAKGESLLKQILYLLNIFDLITISSAMVLNREFNKNNQISFLKERLKQNV